MNSFIYKLHEAHNLINEPKVALQKKIIKRNY